MILNYETLEEMQGIKRPSLATSKAMQTTTISSKAAQTSAKTSPSKSSSRSSSTKVRKSLRERSSHRRPAYLDKDYLLDFELSDSGKTPKENLSRAKRKKGPQRKGMYL